MSRFQTSLRVLKETAMSSESANLSTDVLAAPQAEAIRLHLEQIVASPEFVAAPKLARFLSFVVETALDGNTDRIKESLIAIEVYGRRPDYNPQIDSTVRVEAGRLRARLRQYYNSIEQHGRIRIDIPKGSYVPLFEERESAPRKVENNSEVSKSAIRSVRPFARWYAFAGLGLATVFAVAPFPYEAGTTTNVDPQVSELYHRAQELLRIPVLKEGVPDKLPSSVTEAVRLFQEVTSRSPNFAPGWAGLAEACEWEYELRGNQPHARLVAAKTAARRAIDLKPDLVEAWTVLTSILFFREWDIPGAESACKRTIELDPRNTTARQRYIDILRIQGRIAEARAELDRAIRVHPAIANFRVRKAVMLYQAGEHEAALIEARISANLTNQMPTYPMSLWVQGLSLQGQGRIDEAERIFRASLAFQPHDPWNEPALGHLLASTGREVEAERILAELRLQLDRGRLTHVAMALLHTALGERDEALSSLERGMAVREDSILFVSLDPRLRPLHSEPRFQQLVNRIRGATS